jgi:murein DD-endopeptidase MepM/ murein hydrolase activator NlpD
VATVVAAVATLSIAVAPALGQDVEIPSAPSSTPAAGAAPAPVAAAAPAVAAAPAAPTAARVASTPTLLKVGSRGQLVRDLQRELRRRGIRVSVDGAFGPATRAAVRKLQKRMRLKATGTANAAFLKRLGIKARTVAAVSAPVTPTIAPGASPYLRVFPVAGEYSYSDDYGAARHQGRHEGVDIMADRDTPLVAVDDVTVKRLTRTETGLGGIWVWLQRADGTEYYYAHMASIAPGIDVGTKLTAGQVVGGVGNTGDARYGAAHLHFEVHPGGGASTDPYPHLVAVDPTAR